MRKRLLTLTLSLLTLAAQGTIKNPMLWADVPDPDVIRVGDTYYMVTTTMHLMPGAPIMQSRDLEHWETIGYLFDRLDDSPRYDLLEGTVYGRGQWATSLKYHDGRFYALFSPNESGDMGRTYIMTAPEARGPWTLLSRLPHFHDATLFFDDDDRVYVVYGTGEMVELSRDMTQVIEGSHVQLFQREADETGILEGSRVVKHDGRYYLLMISQVWGVPGRHRREVCYRADDIRGPYEKKTILETDFGGFPHVGQGTIVDTECGHWYGIIFQDRGGVGRVLTLMPCRWTDGWPMLGDEEGRIPESLTPDPSPSSLTPCPSPIGEGSDYLGGIVGSDDFNPPTSTPHAQGLITPLSNRRGAGGEAGQAARALASLWQWNHNPIDTAWSLTERPGFLRLKTCRVVPNLYLAPNTLTQRMEGPGCSGVVTIDVSHMRDGDCCGLAAFNGDSGVLTIKKKGRKLYIEMSEQSVALDPKNKAVTAVDERIVESTELSSIHQSPSTIHLKLTADFRPGRDTANFYYSTDGTTWTQIGSHDYKMQFDYRRFFMGTKFAIFNYATRKTGGYIDVDAFEYTRE